MALAGGKTDRHLQGLTVFPQVWLLPRSDKIGKTVWPTQGKASRLDTLLLREDYSWCKETTEEITE